MKNIKVKRLYEIPPMYTGCVELETYRSIYYFNNGIQIEVPEDILSAEDIDYYINNYNKLNSFK